VVYIPRLLSGITEPQADKIAKYLGDELLAIARELQGQDYVALKVWHVVPDKPRQGYLYYADGTDWNPGSGQGAYVYSGTAWNFLG